MLDKAQASSTSAREGLSLGHVRAIDGLRALAVTSVMAFHLVSRAVPGGFLGVDIFFAISGFVVTASIATLPARSLVGLQAQFYARRILRIFPALAACLLITALAYVLFIPPAWLSDDIKWTGLAAVFGGSNIQLGLSHNEYFAPKAAFNPFTHTWSLGVEEQFYLLFPLLVFPLLVGFDRRRPGRELALYVVAALTIASLVLNVVQTRADPQQAFYLLPARYWELGAGMLLCLTVARWRPVLAHAPRLGVAIAALALVLAGSALTHPWDAGSAFPLALPAVLGTLGLIAVAVASPQCPIVRPFAAAPAAFVGRISYSLYLWHWPIFVLMRWTYGLATWPQYLLALALTFGAAVASYRYVETPFRRWWKGRPAPPFRVIAKGGFAAVCTLAAMAVGFQAKSRLTLSVTRDVEAWYSVPPKSPLPAGCSLARSVRYLGAVKVQSWIPSGCAKPGDAGRLIVVGDSHAAAYTRILVRFAAETGRPVIVYGHSGCPFLGFQRQMSVACAGVEERLSRELGRAVTADDVIFLPSLRLPRLGDQFGDADAPNARTSPAPESEPEARPEPILAAIRASRARIVFEGPTPVFRTPTFRCADWYDKRNPICAPGDTMQRAELQRIRGPVMREITAVGRRDPGVSVWDPFPILCPGEICRARDANGPLFFDADHLSGHGNDVLYPSFSRFIQRAFAERPAIAASGGSE
jgi:peptidoglycan/LPS O-acetylase OafA/YrhL